MIKNETAAMKLLKESISGNPINDSVAKLEGFLDSDRLGYAKLPMHGIVTGQKRGYGSDVDCTMEFFLNDSKGMKAEVKGHLMLPADEIQGETFAYICDEILQRVNPSFRNFYEIRKIRNGNEFEVYDK
jgi:hypothetical protein